jgi:hypothetical protein
MGLILVAGKKSKQLGRLRPLYGLPRRFVWVMASGDVYAARDRGMGHLLLILDRGILPPDASQPLGRFPRRSRSNHDLGGRHRGCGVVRRLPRDVVVPGSRLSRSGARRCQI